MPLKFIRFSCLLFVCFFGAAAEATATTKASLDKVLGIPSNHILCVSDFYEHATFSFWKKNRTWTVSQTGCAVYGGCHQKIQTQEYGEFLKVSIFQDRIVSDSVFIHLPSSSSSRFFKAYRCSIDGKNCDFLDQRTHYSCRVL